MGCDITSFVEVRDESGKWVKIEKKIFPDGRRKTSQPFSWRSYGMFGFLADVRNYSQVPCITGERRGWPLDSDEPEDDMGHSLSYIILEELIDFNYDKTFLDRRTVETIGNITDCDAFNEQGGKITTFREFLGKGFFNDIEILKTLGKPVDVRVVFSFDS